jgi:subtilisin family serine protease
MRRLVGASLIAVGVLAACTEQPSAPATSSSPQSNRLTPSFALVAASGSSLATGRHIVSFTGKAPADFTDRVEGLGGTVLWVSSASGLATVSGLTSSAATALAATAGIQEVDADEGIALDIPSMSTAETADDAGVNSNANPAGAVRYARQWNMRAVRADSAWAHGFLGSSSVKIYMLDTGIDYLHADLLGRVDLTNSTDLLGTFLVAVVVNNVVTIVPFTEADTVAKFFPGRAAFTDLFFHGTHTGATVSSNAVRAAGITSGTQLVAVKVCAYLNICPFSSILNGVIYASNNGADVINMSLGGGFAKAGNGRFVGLINKVFNYARSKGVTTVVSAGNAAADLDHNGNVYSTFCNTPAVICVAATGPTAQASVNGPWTNVDAPATYTNFGRSAISVAAPGGNHASFVWAACSQTSLLVNCSSLPIFILGVQGTSMAAPHVTGTAALLVPILGRNPGAIKARIQSSADDLGQPGTDPFYGRGRLNVARAVGAIP